MANISLPVDLDMAWLLPKIRQKSGYALFAEQRAPIITIGTATEDVYPMKEYRLKATCHFCTQ